MKEALGPLKWPWATLFCFSYLKYGSDGTASLSVPLEIILMFKKEEKPRELDWYRTVPHLIIRDVPGIVNGRGGKDIKIGSVFCNSKVMSSVICVLCSCGCVIPTWGMLLQVQHSIYGQFKTLFLLILTNPKGMAGSEFTGLVQRSDLEKSLEMSPYTLLLFLKRHRHYHRPCSIIHTHIHITVH